MEMNEQEMIEKAKVYLKQSYGEDTVSMEITDNSVDPEGSGTLAVDCTVSVGGSRSDWSKKFYFKKGGISRMDWKRR